VTSDNPLQQLLEAVSNSEYCREVDRRGTGDFDLGPILGEMDWVAEMHRIFDLHKGEKPHADNGRA
jgi:hypothetical protein